MVNVSSICPEGTPPVSRLLPRSVELKKEQPSRSDKVINRILKREFGRRTTEHPLSISEVIVAQGFVFTDVGRRVLPNG